MVDNYSFQDALRGALGVVLLAPVFVGPGCALAWALDVRGFRSRGTAAQAAIAVVLSVALSPALTFLVARATSPRVAAALYGVGTLALLAAAARRVARGARPTFGPMARVAAAAALLWTALALVETSDLQLGNRLYATGLFFDYAKDVSVTDAIVRTGVPPVNPSFLPGHPIALYYYYYWFLLCGLGAAVGGTWVDARAAIVGGTVWAGLALIAVVALYVCDVWPAPRTERRRTVRVALAFLFVSGLDVLYVLARELRFAARGEWYVYATVEGWNEQVTAWTNAVLWVPHHTAGLVAGLAALLLAREAAARERPPERWALGAACGVALASMVGLSIWVAVSFAASWGAWIVVAWWRDWRREARVAFAAGVLGGVLSLPFVRDLGRANLAPGRMPVGPTIRRFNPLDDKLDAHAGLAVPVRVVARLAALPVNYLAEFGFFAVAAAVFWWWRRRRPEPLSRDEAALLTVGGASLFVSTFIAAKLRYNDLGWRGIMAAQFVTLLWATYVWVALVRPRPLASAAGPPSAAPSHPALAPWVRSALLGTLAVGIATVVYDAVMLRAYPLLRDFGVGIWLDQPVPPVSDGARLFAYRMAYEQTRRALPPTAVLQPNPVLQSDPLHQYQVDTYTGMYARRQIAIAHREYGTLYGVPDSVYNRFEGPIDTVFGNPEPILSVRGQRVGKRFPTPPDWPAVAALCQRMGITAWVVTAGDPVWQRPGSWVWQRPALVANALVRVIRC